VLTRVFAGSVIFHKKRGKPRKSSFGSTKSSTNFEADLSPENYPPSD